MSKITIIIPVYNSEHFLPRCVDSVLCQTYRDIEVLLIDDGSTDASPALCDEYARLDSRVRVFHTTNQGAGAARNVGLDNVSIDSDFISFVDSDDWIHPEMYEHLICEADGKDIVVCDFTMVGNGVESEYKTFEIGQTAQETISNMLKDGYGGNPWNKIIRKEIIGNNIRFEPYVVAEDVLFVTQCFAFSGNFAKVNKPLYYYNSCFASDLGRRSG